MPAKKNKKMTAKQVAYSRRRTLCQELYQYCLIPNDQFKFETTFIKIFEILEHINEEEKDIPFCASKERTSSDFENFIQFLNHNKCETNENLRICKNDEYEKDFGVIAAKCLTKGELVFSVPDNLILTADSLEKNKLKELISQDKMLSSMANVALALTVLYIRINSQNGCSMSKWLPYMNILPNEFNTPLYFSLDEIKSLKSSQYFTDIIFHIRNIVRIYSYIVNLFETNEQLEIFSNNLSFINFRWAVSVVSTRQNKIHDENNKPVLAMIPLLDMCNHQDGQYCTDYDDKSKSALCYAQSDLKIGDQIKIFYGSRTNQEMLIHNGFVCEKNKYDRIRLRLSINNQDVLFNKRLCVLKKFFLNSVEVFEWDENTLNYGKLLPRLFFFAKIFVAKTEEELESIQNDQSISDEDYFKKNDLLNDKDVKQFLKLRLSILIKSIEMGIKNCLKTTNGIFINRLLVSERNLLQLFLDFLSNN